MKGAGPTLGNIGKKQRLLKKQKCRMYINDLLKVHISTLTKILLINGGKNLHQKTLKRTIMIIIFVLAKQTLLIKTSHFRFSS